VRNTQRVYRLIQAVLRGILKPEGEYFVQRRMLRKRPRLFALFLITVAIAAGVALLQLRRGDRRQINDAIVVVTVKPRRVLIEASETGQHVNFDFLLENRSDRELKLTTVELSVFDRRGALARRDFVNLFSRASVAMESEKLIPPRGSILLYNPMPDFAASVPLHRLVYDFSFTNEDYTGHAEAHAEVLPEAYKTRTNLILPLRGRILNWDGHDLQSHHRRFDYTAAHFRKRGSDTNYQRYGYDFVLVDERGSMVRGPRKVFDDWYRGPVDNNSDYLGFGSDVLAAGAGTVAALHDGEPDSRRFDEAELQTRETAYGGNYIVIDHGNGEYSWFGHLQQGSIRVRLGERVQQGQAIARLGASGDSLFPHLHYELRTGAGARGVEGLPSEFTNFRRLLGTTVLAVERGAVATGDIVESHQ
jgi:murein DD-endopeptidase MepM/ murein hydrolase activator NlpD